MSLVEALLDYLRREHPRSLKGVEEARAVSPQRFDALAELYLGWAQRALGERAIARTVDAFVRFSFEVNLAQARYEADGHYAHKSYAECYQEVYAAKAAMDDYLWGVYLTNFLWAHHLELTMLYEDHFVARLPADTKLVELAPGHGGWGLLALHRAPGMSLEAYDISPSSIDIASALAQASGLAPRARYQLRDALSLSQHAESSAQAVVCNFLVEHLEQPETLFEVIHHLLAPGGRAFVSGALTAAQVDHIYEMRRESELVLMAERHGLRLLHSLSVGPQRTLRGARFLPRSMSMILQRRTREHW